MRQHVRAQAVQLVRDARQRRAPGPVRHCKRPVLNVADINYTELVDLHQQADIEPPLTRSLSDELLQTGIPCNRQSTERGQADHRVGSCCRRRRAPGWLQFE